MRPIVLILMKSLYPNKKTLKVSQSQSGAISHVHRDKPDMGPRFFVIPRRHGLRVAGQKRRIAIDANVDVGNLNGRKLQTASLQIA